MSKLVEVLKGEMRHELVVVKEWIENELHRLGASEEIPTAIHERRVPRWEPTPPLNYGNNGEKDGQDGNGR